MCRSLVERWSRAVFNKTLDFSKLAELEAEKAENEAYRRRGRLYDLSFRGKLVAAFSCSTDTLAVLQASTEAVKGQSPLHGSG